MDDLRGLTGETLYSTDLEIWLDAGNSSSYPGSGTTWTDLENDYDGTLNNGVGYSSSNNGYLTFDGSNDYVQLNNTDGINAPMSKNMTISVWLYRTKSFAWQGVFTKDMSNNNQWGLFISNGNRFVFGANGSNLYTSQYYSSTWYNVVCVQAANSSRKIYVNGTLAGTRTSSFGTDNAGSEDYHIGRAGSVYFGGRISHALLYENEALTSSQVSDNFDALKSRYGY